ncbi:MAG: 2-polyprenyl-3-methyl-5-hydroxy-6-metoxy-1,4-benzoquinol methylase [Candidatus Aldehydirespiratoraceae bacterium]|jgi:2-polyprenyl-3-methyl-5-hydroxy-6-metoxy-1,4-benzoquinol methylase
MSSTSTPRTERAENSRSAGNYGQNMTDTSNQTEIDPDRLKMFSFGVFSQLSGAVTAGMIHLGDRLGLFQALAGLGEPSTTQALADSVSLDERWVREWAHNQAAAKIIDVDASVSPELFSLSPEAVAVLASPDHVAFGMGMFHRFPQTMGALEKMPESFQTGLGHDYDSHGCEGAIGIEKSFEPWMRHHLIDTVVPALDGMVEKLDAGATVIDIGCGAGGAVLMMATRFPNSTFVGYDISERALERANERLAESDLSNARFVDPRNEAMPNDGSCDLVTTFDCIHDMTQPQEMMESIRSAVANDGTWLLVDIKGRDSFAENVEKNPMASLMYGISVLSCMSSALSSPGGAGLGTLGLPASKAKSMSSAAGFSQFAPLDIDHSVNSFYEIRV